MKYENKTTYYLRKMQIRFFFHAKITYYQNPPILFFQNLRKPQKNKIRLCKAVSIRF